MMADCKTEREKVKRRYKKCRRVNCFSRDDFCSWAGRHRATVEQLEEEEEEEEEKKKKKQEEEKEEKKVWKLTHFPPSRDRSALTTALNPSAVAGRPSTSRPSVGPSDGLGKTPATRLGSHGYH